MIHNLNTNNFNNFVKETEPNICQIVVLKNGELTYSNQWNNYTETDCAHITSVTKSIMSLLIGIAIDQGKIKSVEDKVLDYFPEYKVKRGEKTIFDITIKHLLSMRAPYKGKGDPWTKVCSSDNWTFASLDFLGGKKGITDEFNYRTVCLHILSGILNKATKMKTIDFANKYLFEPLGIANHINYHVINEEQHKKFILDKLPKQNIWFSDPKDLVTPGYGLCMNALDMSKIGQLCLNKGFFDGKQIISEHWITEMTNPRIIENNMFKGMSYGYLWWIIHPEKKIFSAIGDSGNVIYINPDKELVVAITSYFKPMVLNRIDFIENNIIPLF